MPDNPVWPSLSVTELGENCTQLPKVRGVVSGAWIVKHRPLSYLFSHFFSYYVYVLSTLNII